VYDYLAHLVEPVEIFYLLTYVSYALVFLLLLRGFVAEFELRSIGRDFLYMRHQRDRRIVKKRSFLSVARQLRLALWEDRATSESTATHQVEGYFRNSYHPVPYLSAQLSREEVNQLILNDAMERFGSDAVALISNSESPASIQVLIGLRRGIVGERLRKALADHFLSFFMHHDTSSIGFIDHLFHEDRFVNMPLFGYRFSLSGVVEGEPQRVVWLGFSEKNRNTFEHQDDFAKYCSEIARALREYTEIKHMELKYTAEKEQSDERAKLLAYASHDMRSPINNLRAIIRLLSVSEEGEDRQYQISAALRNCDVLAEIVDDALDYSRYRAGALSASKEQVSCATIVEKALFGYQELAREKGITIINEVRPTIIACADGRHISRIISNLIGNAIKYTDQGQVHISAQGGAVGRISLLVRDTGIGMSQSHVRDMFLPYKRFVDQSIQGEGLGLALCKIFAELNDCHFRVDSALGLGTSITLDLPGTVIEPSTLRLKDRSFALAKSTSILIVDDHKSARDSLRRALEMHGFTVEVVASIREAVSFVRYYKPQTVITDLTFPEEEGEALIDFILFEKLTVNIIVVSGRELRREYSRLHKGIQMTILNKPVELSVLINLIVPIEQREMISEALCA
jgi:signal transduction histidine kinase